MLTPIPFHIEAWALVAAILFFKMLFNSLVQGFARSQTGVFRAKEDASIFPRRTPSVRDPGALMERAGACWRNDLENIPMFLLVALGYIAMGSSTSILVPCLAAFTVARIAHTFFYLGQRQPHRTIAFVVGSAANVVLGAAIVWRVFRTWTLG